jgi:3-hydroxyacyl-CoA dehydrogenase
MPFIQDNIAIIQLPEDALFPEGQAARRQIMAQLDAAQANDSVQGVVLLGDDVSFAAAAPATGFAPAATLAAPTFRDLVAAVQSNSKPVVAAIAGDSSGLGLELALACHARVALTSTRIAFSDIHMGLIPGAGGTQCLPRLIGVDAALGMLLHGQIFRATDPVYAGVFNEVCEGDVLAAATRQIAHVAAAALSARIERERGLDAATVQESVNLHRSKLNLRQRLQPAYQGMLYAVAASTLPLAQGLEVERKVFEDLLATTAARALHYLPEAEYKASQLPPALDATARPVDTIAVIGAGTMGAGIAISALEAGLKVFLLEQNEEALGRGHARIAEHYRERVQSGKMKAARAAACESRLVTSIDWTQLNVADMVIEAVFEDLGVKQEVFAKIDAYARSGAVLATNTSYLDVDAIAQATMRPQDVLGLHFFSPANVMKLLEVVRGRDTAPDVLATAMALGVRLQKVPVMCGNAFGFIGNRIYNAYRRQCEFMLEDGAWPEEVDAALTGMGFAMGPFAVADLSGLDIAWRMRKAQAAMRDPRERYVSILEKLCEQGRLGRKTNAGYYVYTDGKKAAATDLEVRSCITQASADRGIMRRTLPAAEIQRRALLAMVNEAALLLAESVASRAEDIDVVLTQGYGFPRWEGGPVFWAQQQERKQLQKDLAQLSSDAGFGHILCNIDVLL